MHAGSVISQRGRIGGDWQGFICLARHHATHRLRQYILPALVCIRPGFAVSGADRIDDGGIELAAIFIAQTETLHDAGAKIIDDHIGLRHQCFDGIDMRRVSQVESGAALVAVQAAKDGIVIACHRLKRGTAQIAGADTFDLDDIGAVIAQHLGADRAHHHLRKVDDANTAERQILIAAAADIGAHAASCAAVLRINGGTASLALPS